MRFATVLAGSLVLAAVLTLRAQVVPGSLDATFGTGGTVTTDYSGGTHDHATAVMFQQDGKIVVAGIAGTDPAEDFGLARYNVNGTLDTTFGSGGKVTTDFFGGPDLIWGAARQPDGRIVAAGWAFSGAFTFALVRYNADGTLDPSFGSGGKVTTTFTSWDRAYAMAFLADGRIVVVGSTGSGDFAVARYHPDGNLDAGFGTGGKVTTDIAATDEARAVAIQPDGKIVVAGIKSITGLTGAAEEDFAVVRYTANGSLDSTFGVGGKVTTDFFSKGDQAGGVALQPDGKIVAAGTACAGDSIDTCMFALARYTSVGALDASFGTGGRVTTGFPAAGYDLAAAVAVQADGRILASGRANCANTAAADCDFALARYNPNGTPDSSFGTGGLVATSFAVKDVATSFGFQADGNIVAVGTTCNGTLAANGFLPCDFAVARYIAGAGALDTIPPVLTVPAGVTVNATSPSGATVTYSASATDNVDPAPAVACVPVSGSTFPVGVTTVTCTASDASGNSAAASFGVTVKDADAQVSDLRNVVASAGLPPAVAGSLDAKLRSIPPAGGSRPVSCHRLKAFINEVQAQSGKAIPAGLASQLTAAADQIRAVLGC